MDIVQNVSLATYSTMRLGGVASYATEVSSRNDIVEAIAWAREKALPILMVGGGSNIFWRDEGFPGLILVNKIQRYESFAEDEENLYITIGSGEIWDSVVARSVAEGASGIECLSLIPGTAGATPIQNVGAYGQEISQTLVSVEAYDNNTNQFITIPNADCAFSYRSSRFKTTDRGRFYITGLTLHLMRTQPQPPFYPALESYLKEKGITNVTSQTIRDAVIAIRQAKLPDPAIIANNGSFFANPIIDQGQLTQLLTDFPDMVYWPTADNQAKLSAAWLLERAGFKDIHDPETGMATWKSQPLVFVNEHAQHTQDLIRFKDKIVNKVEQLFSITLAQEPELLP